MTVIVLHDIGDRAGGTAWRAALDDAGIDDVWAPDLAGHNGAAPPTGGNYTRLDPAYTVARAVVAGLDLSDAVLVGVGHSGWSALVMAVAGQGTGLVLVDGLGTPWVGPAARGARRRAAARAISLDAAAVAPAGDATLDPRLSHRLPPHGDEALVRDAARAVSVPTLLIGADHAAATTVATDFGGGVTVIDCEPSAPAVAPHLADWLRRF